MTCQCRDYRSGVQGFKVRGSGFKSSGLEFRAAYGQKKADSLIKKETSMDADQLKFRVI